MRSPIAIGMFALAAGLVLTAAPRAGAAEDQKWGTIKGQVVYDGEAPQPQKIDVNKDQDHCLSKGPLYTETWVVNPKNKGVRWAVVWLQPVPDKENPLKKQTMPVNPALKAVPSEPAVMDQPCCKFEPHALAVRQGQTLLVKNSAPIPHNVHWTGGVKNPGNNVIVPPQGKVEITDLVANRFPVKFVCDIHGWMNANVFVFDQPYYAVTDENGNFEIKDAPAGTYNLVIWHEALGYRDYKRVSVDGRQVTVQGTPVTIKPDAVTDLGPFGLKKKD